jgi:non-specific serine/threonine protein kinase
MPAEEPPAFGTLLKRYRVAAGLTQEALAERAHMSARAISDLERGARRVPYRETVALLAAALDLPAPEQAAFAAAARRPPRALATDRDEPAGGTVPDNLPLQLTSFVGREREMAEVGHLLGQTRLLTLTGVGGTGKTRLALQVAGDRLAGYPQGVWLVELAPLADPALVPGAVAAALNIVADASRPLLATLIAVLRARQVLLVLDNCEHLIEACATLADALLHGCPQVQILATSREALGIAGEVAWPVPSLELPEAHQPPREIERCAAVRLFVERAAAVQPRFALTEQNAGVVAQVCRRLDGIPLSLELAAARLRALTAEQLAARLDQRFRLLTGGSRTALPRQQTLQATVDWSFGLLSPAEQQLFVRLSVFAGGFTLEAAEAVCAGGAVAPEEVLDLLARLVDKSLVAAETGAGEEARYRLLETLRQYGRERLVAGEEATEVHDRHAAYYLALAETADEHLLGSEAAAWRAHLGREYDNVRGALAWYLEQDEPARDGGVANAAVELAGALGTFWFYSVHRREGLRWLEQALERSAGSRTPARARALRAAGYLAWGGSDVVRAQVLLEESVELYRMTSASRGLAYALSLLGYVAGHRGDGTVGLRFAEEGLALAREVGDRWLVVWALAGVAGIVVDSIYIHEESVRARAWAAVEEGVQLLQDVGGVGELWGYLHHLRGELAYHEGDYARARAALGAAVAVGRTLGDDAMIAFHVRSLGDVARAEGYHAEATALLEESVALYRELDFDREMMAGALRRLGECALEQGAHATARAHLTESLKVARDVGEMGDKEIAATLRALAGLAAVQGQPERAVRLAAVAEGLADRVGPPFGLENQSLVTGWITAARAALSPGVREAASAEGQAMTQEQAIVHALGEPIDG